MVKDKIVRIKIKKYFKEQKPMCYVGKVLAITEGWVMIDAKGIMLSRLQQNGAQIDTRTNLVMLPRESIDSIRVLPDNFDISKIDITTEGQQLHMVVDGPHNVFLGELGEG